MTHADDSAMQTTIACTVCPRGLAHFGRCFWTMCRQSVIAWRTGSRWQPAASWSGQHASSPLGSGSVTSIRVGLMARRFESQKHPSYSHETMARQNQPLVRRLAPQLIFRRRTDVHLKAIGLDCTTSEHQTMVDGVLLNEFHITPCVAVGGHS